MMEQKRAVLRLLTLMLLLSCLLPFARSRALKNQRDAAALDKYQVVNGEMTGEEEGLMERRLDFEIMDYPGSGASSRHDPWSPGKP